MTMQNALHPDDERLAALAAGDADARDDRALAEHVADCTQCRPTVEELILLRGALASLPDVQPSRPLRLIPPLPAPAARRAGTLGWLRRLAAPAMAVGVWMVLIGAVGASGVVGQLLSKQAGSAAQQGESASDGAGGTVGSQVPVVGPGMATDGSTDYSRTGEPRTPTDDATASPKASADKTDGTPERVDTTGSSEQPWLTLLIAGVALFAVAAALRYSLSPGAG